MPITLPRSVLVPALKAARSAVERRGTIPILSNLLLSAEAGRLTVVGTDLDVEIAVTVDCAGEADAFTLPAATLDEAVRKMPDGAEVTIAPEAQAATVSAGRARFRLQVLPAGDFPRLSAGGDWDAAFALSAAALKRMVETVGFAVSSEEARYYLNGIHLHPGEGADGPVLVAVATDGHRLAQIALHAPEGSAVMPGIILPRRTVGLLGAVTARKGALDIRVSKSRIRFDAPAGEDGPALSIVSKLVDGTFPDYRRVVPAAPPSRFEVEGEALARAVDRVVTIAAGARGSAVKFAFDGDGARLSAVNPDAGEASDYVAVTAAEGDPVTIGFNGRYCLDMLAAAPEGALAFRLGDPGSPARIEPAAAADTLFVLMPMRV